MPERADLSRLRQKARGKLGHYPLPAQLQPPPLDAYI